MICKRSEGKESTQAVKEGKGTVSCTQNQDYAMDTALLHHRFLSVCTFLGGPSSDPIALTYSVPALLRTN